MSADKPETPAITSFQGEHRFLSNFWPSIVCLDGRLYASVEHAYQAAKTLDHESRKVFYEGVLRAGEAKRAGRGLVIRPDWDEVRLGVMLGLLRDKFSEKYSSGLCMRKLLATGDAELIEGNHWGDTFWGVCRGVGQNNLGKLLMRVREELR